MKNRIPKRRWLLVLAIVMSLLLLATACTQPVEPPVDGKKVVKIGNTTCLTGAASSSEQPALQGHLDYVNYFNDEVGIPGVTIEHVWMDCDYDVPRMISNYRKLLEQGVVCLHSNYTPGIEAVLSRLEGDGVPLVSASISSALVWPREWGIYFSNQTYGERAAIVIDYFMENWKGDEPPTIAFMGPDSSYGREPAEAGSKYAESLGCKVLPMEITPYVVIDASTQLLRLEEGGADLVMLQLLQPGMVAVMKDAERLGLLDKMQFYGTDTGVGDNIINISAAEGFLTAKYVPWYDETDIPGMKALVDNQLKYSGNIEREPNYMAGWVPSAISTEAVRRAIAKVGYENLDGLAVQEELENMKDFDAQGLITIDYLPNDVRGTHKAAIYQVQSGKLVRISDWLETPVLTP